MVDGHEVDPSVGMSRREALVKGSIAAAGLGATMYFSGDIGGDVGDVMDNGFDAFVPLHESEHGEANSHESELSEEDLANAGDMHNELSGEFEAAVEELEDEAVPTPNLLQWMGTSVFAHGISELYNGRHITQWHYGAQGALIALERRHLREIGDEEGLHHVDEELAATVLFTGIIEGTVIAAEGMTLDIESIYKSVTGNPELQLADRIAIVTELASMLAPVVTTVGASGMTTKEGQKIVEQARVFANQMVQDTTSAITEQQGLEAEDSRVVAIKALLQSHISDKAGFPFFGDPPFIATLERFGGAGLLWQTLEVGMVPALRSLAYTNTRITKELIRLGAVEGDEKEAGKIARAALSRNFGFVRGVMGRTVKNAFIPFYEKQSDLGMKHNILGSFADKVNGFRDLVFEEHIEGHGHEDEGSRIVDTKYGQFVTGVVSALPPRERLHAGDRISERRHVADFIEAEDFVGLRSWLSEKGMNSSAADALLVGAIEVHKEEAQREGFEGDDVSKWNPLAVYRRVTDVNRMQSALGHGFTDVLDVFPFQSASMIFVSPVFKWGVDKFDSLTEKVPTETARRLANDLGKFAAIAGFSSVADNLVGVREGFKFTEENPAIALIAGIKGGMLLPPGNMANVVEFPLNVYPLEEAKTQIGRTHAQTLAEGFVWAEILGLADRMGIMKFPTPITEKEAAHAAILSRNFDRRSLFGALGGRLRAS